jgi:hypothetical protein
MTAFNSLLGIGVKTAPPTYEALYSGRWQHPGQSCSPQLELELPFSP